MGSAASVPNLGAPARVWGGGLGIERIVVRERVLFFFFFNEYC